MAAPLDVAHIDGSRRQNNGSKEENTNNGSSSKAEAQTNNNLNQYGSSTCNGVHPPITSTATAAATATTTAAEAAENACNSVPSNTSGFYYLTPAAAQAIPKYQYKGEDRSLLYKHVLSPLAQFLVDYCTPRSVAPNSITLLGLSLMACSYLAHWYYVPSLEISRTWMADDATTTTTSTTTATDSTITSFAIFDTNIPRWIFLYNCIAMLVYQTLDNMDGKQARRTKSSSPLGLLFDHGCDAVNSIFGSANWIVAMGLELEMDALWCWVVVIGPYALFYIATWEEYYTGELILPLANGPNEGLFGGALLSLTTYFYGPEFWQSCSWCDRLVSLVSTLLPFLQPYHYFVPQWRIRNADVIVVAAFLGISQEIILKSTSVIRRYGLQALLDILPFFAVGWATLLIGWCDKSIWLEIPRTSLHLVACLIVEMVTELMRAHIASQKFQPFRRWINLPLLVLSVIITTRTAMGLEKPSWTHEYLTTYATASCTYLFLKMAIVVDEICRVLNIWCFDIVTPRPPPTTDSNNTLHQHTKHE